MLPATWKRNDAKAKPLIYIFSIIVFTAIIVLSRVKLNVDLGFNVHLFALANALINSCVSVLLLAALLAVKNRNYQLHKTMMMIAMVLSILFLVSYICHHLFAGETRFGDSNHDGVLSEIEKQQVGSSLMLYRIILFTHIPLAGIILPFILFSAYRGLTGDYDKHRKLVRITWPVWFYVAVTGVIVYRMISPYYS